MLLLQGFLKGLFEMVMQRVLVAKQQLAGAGLQCHSLGVLPPFLSLS